MKILFPILAAALLVVPTWVAAEGQNQGLDLRLLDAAAAGQTDLVKSLLVGGADIESKNNVGATPLIFASVKGHSQVVKLLLDRGANVNAKTVTGITPLIAAAAGGHADIVRLLMQNGADVSAKDQQGRTALNIAEATGDAQVHALLSAAENSSGTAPVPVARPTDRGSTPIARPTSPARTETIRAGDSQSGLTVRAEPSPKGQVMAYLPVGSTITYLGEASNGWIRLSAPIAGGWVPQDHIGSRYPEASVISVDNPEQCLRVRGGPGTNHEKTGCLSKGAKLKLTGTVQSGWAQIAEPMAGWVTVRQIQAPGLISAKPATSGAQKERRGASRGAGLGRQQSDSDPSDFTRVDREFDREISQLRRENEETQAVPGGGILRLGPFGIGFGR